MRNAFIDELISLSEERDNIALVVGDLGYGVVEEFAKKFPKRFFNAGVAEQNMMGLSAGLASEGFQVFVYSIGNFPTFRCAEQVRNDVDYHQLPVTIVAVGGGVAYGNLGYSHHAVQDYAMMRSMPNTLIAAPGDPMEVRGCMRYIVDNPQPTYLRLGKSGESCVHENVPIITPGEWLEIPTNYASSHKTLLTTGATLSFVKGLIDSNRCLQTYSLHSLPLWGMSLKAKQFEKINKYSLIKTVEDHLVDAGFGSWILEAKNSSLNTSTLIEIKALNSGVSGAVGSQSVLWKNFGLSSEDICK